MEAKSFVNHEICKACAFCADVCPNLLIDLSAEKKIYFTESFDSLCMSCGHCMAICPSTAIQIKGLSYENDFFELENKDKESDSFQHIIQKRRAIRKYKNKPIPKEILDKIVTDMSFAPVGFTPSSLEILVINDSQLIQNSVPKIVAVYEKFLKWMKNPIMRFFIRRNAGEENFASLKDHIVPIFDSKMDKIKNEGIDPIYRNAPCVIIIHADKSAGNASEDGIIALTYGFLAAESYGLGTCPISLIPPALNFDENIKNDFSIPEKNKVITAFVVGYPKYKYKRAIKREARKTEYIEN